jgi:hypothetical protein
MTTKRPNQTRIRWSPVVERAAVIAESYDTAVTLRQVFYRLVAEQLIPNTRSAYKTLSDRTSRARRDGTFPALLDQTRKIERPYREEDVPTALDDLAKYWRRDRTVGQKDQIWLIVEKKTLVEQMRAWTHQWGIPVVAVSGFGSQTIIDEIRDEVEADGRKAIGIYLGDLDPSGEGIERDVLRKVQGWDQWERIAVNQEQIDEFGLLVSRGKKTDPRAARFIKDHGELIQVEVEAIEPTVLRGLVLDAITPLVDLDAIGAVKAEEEADTAVLRRLIEQVEEDEDEEGPAAE